VERCRAAGGRVIAVGTTVVRTLETAAAATGRVRPGAGVTRLRITPDHRLRAVDGLLTGLHEPEASHLDLLGAFLAPERLAAAYDAALAAGYLWHEFGDLCLIMPGHRGQDQVPGGGMGWASELRVLAAAAVEAFGQRLAEEVIGRLEAALQREPEPGPRSVSPMAIQRYLAGSAFGSLGSWQVEGWAADSPDGGHAWWRGSLIA
jgi:hypothetical protein